MAEEIREPTEETAPSSGTLTKEQIIAGQTKLRDIIAATGEDEGLAEEDLKETYNHLARDSELIRLLATGEDEKAQKRLKALTDKLMLKTIFATAVLGSGAEKPLTGADFFDLIKKGIDEENPDAEATEKLQILLGSMLDYANKHPEFRESTVASETLDAIQTIYEYLVSTEGEEDPEGQEEKDGIPIGLAKNVNNYVMTKDVLSKSIFGELVRNGKQISIVSDKPGTLTLWTEGKGKSKKEVAVYTRLEFDKDALKAAGVTIGKNVSRRGREVFGAMLSHYLAGNQLLSLGMLGKIIFNTRSDNLTEEQKKYIILGAQEIFGTSLYLNTAFSTDEARRALVPLNQKQKVNITRFEALFPGRITSAYINGSLVNTAIELYRLPTLYSLQNALEKGQVLRVPAEVVEIPGRVDADLITIRAYLLRRVDAMKHNENLSQMIIYKNILDEVGIDPTDRAQRNKPAQALKRVERILEHWKNTGYIKSYSKLNRNGEPVKKGGSVYEIRITA